MKTVSIVAVCFLTGFLILSSFTAVGSIPCHSPTHSYGINTNSQGESYYPIYLVEHNLPKGMLWYASIGPHNGSNFSNPPITSTSSTIEFVEPPGQYSFSVGANGPYLAKELPLYATVVNSSVTLNIHFVEQFNVSITEIGIPQGYNWEIYLTDINNSSNNGGFSGPPFRATQSLYKPSGTYRLQVGSNPVIGVSVLGDVGNITILNGPVNKTIRFYEVNITQEGLPENYTDWGLHYSYSTYYSNGTQSSSSGFYPGTTGPLILYLPNSTYSVHPVARDYYSPFLNFSLDGKSLNLTEEFQRTYSVTFIEHGLNYSVGEYWKISGFPTAYGMNSPYIAGAKTETFLVPNGTFSYSVTGILSIVNINGSMYQVGWTLEDANNTFTVNGNNTTIDLYFNVTLSLITEYHHSTVPSIQYSWIAIVAVSVALVCTIAYFYLEQLREKR